VSLLLHILFAELKGETAWRALDAASTFRVIPDDVRARDNVERVSALQLTEAEFIDRFEQIYQPVVITDVQREWAAKEKWTLKVCVFIVTGHSRCRHWTVCIIVTLYSLLLMIFYFL